MRTKLRQALLRLRHRSLVVTSFPSSIWRSVGDPGKISMGSLRLMKTAMALTPFERLARMRRSFEKNRSILAEDYKYFTTHAPDRAKDQNVKQADKHG
jgi:hypothetical protein